MNTKIHYLYRDASNYKKFNQCVVKGELTETQLDIIMECLDDDLFIPSQVDLPEDRFERWDDQDDNCYMELYRDGFEKTDEAPTAEISAEELVSKFLERKHNWDEQLWAKENLQKYL